MVVKEGLLEDVDDVEDGDTGAEAGTEGGSRSHRNLGGSVPSREQTANSVALRWKRFLFGFSTFVI